MARSKTPKTPPSEIGEGGETHQQASGTDDVLTTNQGIPVSDNQSSLRINARGPTLLEDFVLRDKITHFDHERIPERVVHARGSGAHGYFESYAAHGDLTRASFLAEAGKRTPAFVRFSTVAGGAGSVDTPRDVRGFAVKLYTDEGNFDLVGNNIPVFFIQDAMKFPDLVHAVKMEPDRGFPQAASAHDTFWDFISLMPESMHMIMWAMSDRTIPRSFRMIEGFGVHTFRLVDATGESTFVKFHWRPLLGLASQIWDEAVKTAGADPDFLRRDLWEAIERGDFPEWELSVQVFDEAFAAALPFDVLDATKLIPEELLPLRPLGRLVLDRNPDNFFAETEQVAFHPGNVVPGVDFSDDPLLQGRLFSYIDTQLTRLGGPNFHQIPVNMPKCPMRNFQRDGHMRMGNPPGRVAYEPSSLGPPSSLTPRESPRAGFVSAGPTFAADGHEPLRVRVRSESFADHYSQARLFYRSMTEPEQRHIVGALGFELSKVETVAIRKRMLGHLKIIDPGLCAGVETSLGMPGEADALTPGRAPIDFEPSPALSILAKTPPSLAGKKVGVLVTDGSDAALLAELKTAIEAAGARMELIAPTIGGAVLSDGKKHPVDKALVTAPSVFFDAVACLATADGAKLLVKEACAIDWLRDAFGHLKVIGHTPDSAPLLTKAGVKVDDGVVELDADPAAFVARAQAGRIWDREPKLRSP